MGKKTLLGKININKLSIDSFMCQTIVHCGWLYIIDSIAIGVYIYATPCTGYRGSIGYVQLY